MYIALCLNLLKNVTMLPPEGP